MIYKPNAVSPSFEVVPVKDDTTSFNLIIKGVSSPKIFNRARIYMKQGNIERTYYKNIDEIDSGSGSYKIKLNLKRDGYVDTEEDFFTIDLNYEITGQSENGELVGTEHSIEELDAKRTEEISISLYNNQPIIWKVRLYEDDSFSSEYDDDGNHTGGYYNIGSLRSLFGITNNDNWRDDYTGNRVYYRNMVPIISGGTINSSVNIKVSSSNVIHPRDNTICKSYMPTSQIAYGTIQKVNHSEVRSSKIGDITNYKKLYHLKIYPHDIVNHFSFGNLIFNKDGETVGTYTSDSSTKKRFYTIGYTGSHRCSHPDNKYARYYIKIGNHYYNILDYRYYDWVTENRKMYEKSSDGDDGTLDDKYYYSKGNDYFDSYGNPLALYILIGIDIDNASYEDDITKMLDDCKGLDYSIYCNYIDTDQYSFELSTTPTIEFMDIKNNELSVSDSKEDAINNALDISYSNFKINGELIQPSDTYISEYSSHLYIIKNGVEQLIDEKIGEYSQKYSYEFNELRNKENYILVIKIVDNNGNVTEKYLCISPNYGQPSSLITANVTFDYQRKCNVIDFGDVIDISPDETVKDAHSFHSYDDQDPKYKYLHIDRGNSLVYNKKDNEYGKLSIPDESVINIVVKNDYYNTGQICQMITEGGYIMSLYWNGIQYEYTVQKDGHTTKYIYYPYKEDIDNISDAMMKNMSKPDLSDETPYIWTDKYVNTTFKCKDYVHVETPADMYWHSIIFNKDGIKFMRLGDKTFTEWIAGEAVTE